LFIIGNSGIIQVYHWVAATVQLVYAHFDLVQGQVKQLLLTLFVYLFIFQVDLVADRAILLVNLCILGHYRPCFAILRVSEDQVQGWRRPKDSLTNEFLVFYEISLLPVDVRFEKDEPSIDVALIEKFLDEE
jgi:hypothetical protein